LDNPSYQYTVVILINRVLVSGGWTTQVTRSKKKSKKSESPVEEKFAEDKVIVEEKVTEVTASVVSEEPPQEQRNKRKQKKKSGKVCFYINLFMLLVLCVLITRFSHSHVCLYNCMSHILFPLNNFPLSRSFEINTQGQVA
jgi:hypothetical protein